MIDLYTSMSWEEMCKAVLCLELGLKEEDEATEEEAAKGKDATEEKEATEGKEATVELKAAKEAGRVPI